jgi:hypothetical protein
MAFLGLNLTDTCDTPIGNDEHQISFQSFVMPGLALLGVGYWCYMYRQNNLPEIHTFRQQVEALTTNRVQENDPRYVGIGDETLREVIVRRDARVGINENRKNNGLAELYAPLDEFIDDCIIDYETFS